MIKVTPEAVAVIEVHLPDKEKPAAVRVYLRSTGCCDASLGLTMDSAQTDDLTCDLQGIMLVISPELDRLTGDIKIDYVHDKERTGFVLQPEKQLSEWDGFGVCTLGG